MGKVTKYRKNWKWSRKKYFNYIAKNYLKYTCNVVGKIVWVDQDENNIYWSGINPPTPQWTMQDVLSQAGNELISLRAYFASVKFTGVAVKVTPGYPANPEAPADGTLGNAFLSIQQVGEPVTYGTVVHNPRCMCLSQIIPQRKYFSLSSSWVGSNSIPMYSLNFVLASDGKPMRASTFTCQITIYLLFKTAL